MVCLRQRTCKVAIWPVSLSWPWRPLSAIRLPSLEGAQRLRLRQPHSNCLVVHYQNEQPNYQQRKENNDDDRNNGIPASGRLAIGRFGSGFLRRSDTQQEAHLIPRRLNPAQADRRRRIALYAFAYAFAIANSIQLAAVKGTTPPALCEAQLNPTQPNSAQVTRTAH